MWIDDSFISSEPACATRRVPSRNVLQNKSAARRQALSAASTDLLLDIMRRCQTGPGRIKGMLPPDVVVMHKTGTLNNGITDDVGILTLPNDAGHVVLTVFVKEAKADEATQERAIAQIARAVYDYFVFSVAGKSAN